MVPESRISEILAAESEPDGAGGLSGMRLRLAVLRHGGIVCRVALLLLEIATRRKT